MVLLQAFTQLLKLAELELGEIDVALLDAERVGQLVQVVQKIDINIHWNIDSAALVEAIKSIVQAIEKVNVNVDRDIKEIALLEAKSADQILQVDISEHIEIDQTALLEAKLTDQAIQVKTIWEHLEVDQTLGQAKCVSKVIQDVDVGIDIGVNESTLSQAKFVCEVVQEVDVGIDIGVNEATLVVALPAVLLGTGLLWLRLVVMVWERLGGVVVVLATTWRFVTVGVNALPVWSWSWGCEGSGSKEAQSGHLTESGSEVHDVGEFEKCLEEFGSLRLEESGCCASGAL